MVSMEKVIVTGAGGYIGTTLVPLLLANNYHVTAIDRYFFGEELLGDNNNLKIIKEDSRKIDESLFKDIDYVIDLVAVSNDPSGELFQQATWEINHLSRLRTAKLAKANGVKRYILPSSCSIYGFQDKDTICSEEHSINPLTVYAKANRAAERDINELSSDNFTVVILRQATVYGFSPRMRFDLAINGMTYGAWKNRKLPLMRDGTQWRPMLHVKDAAAAQLFLLKYPNKSVINGEIFNIGSDDNSFQIGKLAELISNTLPIDIDIEWYGDPDHRSYRVGFEKIEALGWKATESAESASLEIYEKLESGELENTDLNITLEWYKNLDKWHKTIKETEMYEGILNIVDK